MALTFYLDASVQIAVARALREVRDDVLYPGAPGCPIQGPEVPDVEWLRIAGDNQWVVILRDKRIRRRPGERRRLQEHGLRVFCLTGAGNYSRWQTLELLVRRWEQIERIARDEPGPYIYAVTQGGIAPLTM